jgi:hypothetical protein
MGRLVVIVAMLVLYACVEPLQVLAQPATTSPADYVLITVVLKHDQSKNLEEIGKIQDEQSFWAKFPPDGIAVESWYIVMGLGQVVTLRVPPARLREVNRAIELTAWKAFRTEIYATYDFKEAARAQRERAQKK